MRFRTLRELQTKRKINFLITYPLLYKRTRMWILKLFPLEIMYKLFVQKTRGGGGQGWDFTLGPFATCNLPGAKRDSVTKHFAKFANSEIYIAYGDAGGQFAFGVNDISGKFATGANAACRKLPPGSTIAAINFPPVSTRRHRQSTMTTVATNVSTTVVHLRCLYIRNFLWEKLKLRY